MESGRVPRVRTLALSLDWIILDLTSSVTRGKKFLMERFLWKAETVFFLRVKQEIKRLCCSFPWFSVCPLSRLDINCVESPVDAPHEELRYFHIQRGHAAWCCTVPSGTLSLLDIGLNMSALIGSLTASSSLLHPPCMLSTLFQMHSVPAVLLLFANCVIPSVSLLPCISKRKQSLAMCDSVFMCACAIFLLLCSCDVLRWSQLKI